VTSIAPKSILEFLFAVLMALTGGPGVVHAGERRALVIGIADYDPLPKLKTTANDADLFAASLSDAGFDVVMRTNLSAAALLGPEPTVGTKP
jgi:hypothetical protein